MFTSILLVTGLGVLTPSATSIYNIINNIATYTIINNGQDIKLYALFVFWPGKTELSLTQKILHGSVTIFSFCKLYSVVCCSIFINGINFLLMVMMQYS